MHVVVTLSRERRRLDIRAKPSTRNVLCVMSVNSPLALSSLSEEMTSACVENAMIQVMLRQVTDEVIYQIYVFCDGVGLDNLS